MKTKGFNKNIIKDTKTFQFLKFTKFARIFYIEISSLIFKVFTKYIWRSVHTFVLHIPTNIEYHL